jgi:DNA (cytosine-5)-methyltransferase 1
VKALDLFAGTGWGVACQRLGIKESGVEIMPEAVETRTANGMETIYRDVWDGLTLTAEQHREQYGPYGLLIASPPCQTFSMAGNGKGRDALNEVIEAIDLHAYKDADALRAFGEKHDPRTALVLTPLAYVWRDRPRLVAMEQVPTVLPVWEACAEVMREWGYEVKVEILNAEQYGVPQTRKRAILVARRGGPVHLPKATHSRYYSRTPDKLDPGVQKWVSMAEALGWTADEAEGSTYTGNNKLAHQAVRTLDQPAPTVTAGHDSGNRGFIDPDGQFFKADVEQVAALQSYPTMLRSNYGTGGDASARGERKADQPAPTLTSKADRNKWDGELNMTADEAAALQSYPASSRGLTDRPSPTILAAGGAGGPEPLAKFHARYTSDPAWTGPTHRLTRDEAAHLQSYEPPFIWCGTKTKQFLQIGNAVPPLLAEHILAALIGIRPGR